MLDRKRHAWLDNPIANLRFLVEFSEEDGTDALIWISTMEETTASTNRVRLPGKERGWVKKIRKMLSLQVPMRRTRTRAKGEEEILISGVQVDDASDFVDGEAQQFADLDLTGPSIGLIFSTKTAMSQHDDFSSQSRMIIRNGNLMASVATARSEAEFHFQLNLNAEFVLLTENLIKLIYYN